MTIKVDIPVLRQAISEHPWSSVALAIAAGGWLAGVEPRGRIARAAASVLGALAFAALRETAAHKAAEHAKSWIDQHVQLSDTARAVS
jgi:hypothetical protein